ncbi:MAG TPA: right-handed parallel beta-helix repeat-containing protein, partial [Lacipirellulaceae bacterium]|nr:right-handed parallel beta-helix repeat-containing protein [Lacipirellulaceae bacterium]
LGLTGAEDAIVALSGADSDRIAINSNEIYSNLHGGIYIGSTNDQPQVTGNRIFDTIDGSTTGIQVASANGAVVDNNSVFNMFFGTGIDVRTDGSASFASSVTNNNVYYTTYAIIAFGTSGNGAITVSGNDVHDTRSIGIQGNDQTQIIGNTVHDNPTGISATIARNNTVYANQYGINLNLSPAALAQGNRVFNNSILGIAGATGIIQSNAVYSNYVGMRVAGTVDALNNVIYDNDNDGIWVWRDTTARIENNTIDQSGGGDAIQIGGSHSEENISTFPGSAVIQNNILHVDQGYAMNFAADSGVGSTVDYNDFDITGTGKLARWQNRDFTDRADWFYELGFDQHSQTADPQFLNPEGADGLLGFSSAPTGAPIIIDNGDAGYSSQGQWDTVAQSNGYGGDFLENSTGFPGSYPNATANWQFTGSKVYPDQANLFVDIPVQATWVPHLELGTATYSYVANATYTVTYQDTHGQIQTQTYTPSFNGTITSLDQSQIDSFLTQLHLTLPNVYTIAGFISVTDISFSVTLTVSGGHNIIADRATMFGEIVGDHIMDGQTVDDGDAAFSKNGYNWVPAGRDGDYQVRSTANPTGTATYEFTGLTPGFYDVSAFWTDLPDNAQVVEITVFDSDHPTHWTLKNEFSNPSGFTDSNGVNWSPVGVVRITGDRLVVKVAGDGKLQADAVRIQRLVGDNSADDDFHVAPTSPTIDAGNPTSSYANEPASSGGRINLGSTGNTTEATTSPAQLLQVLTPNGLEKTEQGQQLPIQWRTFGVPPIAIPDAPLLDSPLVFYKLDETTGSIANDSSGNGRDGTYTGGVMLGAPGGLNDPSNYAATFDGVNDYIAVPSPAAFATSQVSIEAWIKPDPTIQTFATVAMKSTSNSWSDGYGMHWISGKLRFFINSYSGSYVEAAVPTGSWSFVTGTYDGATIKLYVNGVLVASSNYSAPINNSAQPLQVGRGGGNNYYWKGGLDEVGVYGTALTADQVKVHYSRSDPGDVSIQLVNASTSDVTTIAASTPNDGDYTWTVPADLAPGQYRIRVTASLGISPSDDSDAPFLVVPSTHDYYVNDSSLVGDVFTTAIGNNANSGKSPDAPMASIQALLTAYDLDPGDVIHVDTGTYTSLSNITIGAQDSGVRIEGPGAIGGAGTATLNRGNTVGGSWVIQLTGADNVTLDYLDITGGDYGIVATNTADSDGLTISHTEIHDNAHGGISLDTSNDGETIVYNQVHNLTTDGIALGSVRGATVQYNVVHNVGGNGIRLSDGGSSSTIHNIISDNELYANATGIFASGVAPIDILRNLSHNNATGINASQASYAANNTVYANSSLGISAFVAVVENNTVYGNGRGIDTSQSTIRNNRIFHNTGNGISGGATGSQIIGNTIYGQNLGILMAGADYAANNLIYDNANDGIWVWRDSGARIENNTIYQTSTGDAIQIAGTHPEQFLSVFPAYNVTITNNILRVAQGYAINVAADSEIGFASDYNDFAITGTGKLAHWEDKDFTTREDWFFQIGVDSHSTIADPQFVDIDGADNKLGYDVTSNTDYGLDDNFGVLDTSPTIDAGNPTSVYAAEPGPNGNRINLGHTGNTAQATASFTQSVQVLSPNGLEKLEVAQPVAIQWQTAGMTSPTANIELSTDNGASWTTIAQNVATDSSGHGSYSWTPTAESAGNTALIRVTANVSGAPHDVSDTPFLITNAGHDYYINDNNSTNDVFTSALGNDLNSGKSPNQPMASLPALLAAYDLDPGDVIHVDSGTYRIYRNIQLSTQDSGVRIEGPAALPAGQALQATATLNRGNNTSTRYVFEMTGGDDVTIDHLAATGAEYGLYASSIADSDRLTVSNSDFFSNKTAGIFILDTNEDAHILNNTARNHTVSFNAPGIDVQAARGLIQGNDVFGNIVGIYASYFGSVVDQIVVAGNKAHGNSSVGIWANNRVLVTNNTAYDQTASGAIGIESASNQQDTPTTGNIIFNNSIGIYAASANGIVETIQNNWAYKNTIGIRGTGVAQILGNHTYSNTTGISGVSYQGLVANNIVYANANYGIFVENSFIPGGKIFNNTVYQIVGDAVRLENVSQGFSIRNNILWNESGYDINIAASSSTTNITSNYNLLHQSTDPNAHVGFWANATRDSINDWQTASAQDANSVAADPLFVDRDGSDNVLGYRASDGYDGGRDDNFLLLAGSPAIDRADGSIAPTTD